MACHTGTDSACGSANIVAAASQESQNANAAVGPYDADGDSIGNYQVSGAKGTFTETPGSGQLSFTDATDNTIFALVPQVSIAPGTFISLNYAAEFDNTTLGLKDGAAIRSEALVSFGNAGARGGSGATATNIDINGNGVIDTDEANVRTVACRWTTVVPTSTSDNSSVDLNDRNIESPTPGAATLSGWGASPVPSSAQPISAHRLSPMVMALFRLASIALKIPRRSYLADTARALEPQTIQEQEPRL